MKFSRFLAIATLAAGPATERRPIALQPVAAGTTPD